VTTYSEFESTFNDRAAETMQSRDFQQQLKQPQKPSGPLNIDDMEIPGAKLKVQTFEELLAIKL